MMRTGIIIQARMGSSRLPGKVLRDYNGKTLLQHIVERLERRESNAKVVIATSNLPQDDMIEQFCRKYNVSCFRGDEKNVLKRYCDCALMEQFDHIVRMTGDNPFPDIEELDKLIQFHINSNMDFTENFSVLPVGVGMEIISKRALLESLQDATLPKHFEHADEYILDNLSKYRHSTLDAPLEKKRPEVRLTVDTAQDYKKVCYILKRANTAYVATEQAIMLSDLYDSLKKENVKLL